MAESNRRDDQASPPVTAHAHGSLPAAALVHRPGNIEWERFWHASDDEIPVEEGGFLIDPRGEYGHILNPRASTLEGLEAVGCLVLLGEPGAGKSTELLRYAERLQHPSAANAGSTSAEPHGAPLVVFRNLADYDSVADLVQDLFRGPGVSAALDEGSAVTILLDSFDEARLAIAPLATRLATELRGLPDAPRRAQLRVRLACRSFEFPETLRGALGELWPADGFRVVELAPLRWRDVVAAAESRLGAADAAARFMDRVVEREAVPFATLPGKLDFLLRVYAERGDFPPRQAELYLEGCRYLAQEVNESRLASRRAGALDPEQRLAIASRIAAATLFGNRRAVWAGPDLGDVPSTDVPVATLLGRERCGTGFEAAAREVEVTADAVKETLGTGLFSIHGRAERAGWAHQSYAEFLAAWWLVRHGLTTEQVAGLLCDPDDPHGGVVPQLHGVAAWLAGMRPDVYRLVAERDPRVLLRADTQLIPHGDRAVLVDALLRASEANTLRWRGFGERVPYERLAHPALADQLLPVIADRARPEHVRSFAIEIAEGCELTAAGDACASVALDPREPVRLRADAAGLVAEVGEPDVRARLVPLATTPLPEDVDDDIKGAALRATCQLLSPEALFGALTRARRPNRTGAYEGFLLELGRSLTPTHLAPGLAWVERMGHMSGVGASKLKERVILEAIPRAEEGDIREGLVRLARQSLARYQPLLDHDALPELRAALVANDVARLAIARDLVELDPRVAQPLPTSLLEPPAAQSPDEDATGGTTAKADEVRPDTVAEPSTPDASTLAAIEHHARQVAQSVVGWLGSSDEVRFILPADMPWVVARWVAAAEHTPVRAAWRAVALHLFDCTNSAHVDYIYARRDEPEIDAAFGGWFQPMAVDGPEARQHHEYQREAECRRLERETAIARQRARIPPPSEARIREMLEQPEHHDRAHHWRAWPGVAWELGRSHTEQHSGWEPGDLRETPLWGVLSLETRGHVHGVATGFLERARWRGSVADHPVRFDNVGGPAYQALRSFSVDGPTLAPAVWRRWFPALCAIRLQTLDETERVAHQALLGRAQAVSPRAFASAIGRLLDAAVESERRGRRIELPVDAIHSALGRPQGPHDSLAWKGVAPAPGQARELVVAEMLARCEDVATPGSILDELLGPLLAHDVPTARTLARSLIARLPARGPRRTRSLAAAVALFKNAPDAGWPDVWPVMRRSKSFAQEVVRWLLAHREHPVSNIKERLDEDKVAELYIWVARTYPPDEDPWHIHTFSPDWRDNLMHWRESLLSTLESWGTPRSLDALAKVVRAIPERAYLSQPLLRARTSLQSAHWNAPAVSEIFALADQRARRLVRGGEQLLAAVVESLGRYGEQLQGELPAAPTLWDRLSLTDFRPKDEGHLADDIIRHLRRDLAGSGVVVGCELVVDRGVKGVRVGRRTDIVVTAVPRVDSRGQTEIAPVSVVIEVKGSWHPDVMTAMQSQLVNEYLADEQPYRYGVYLVGWYTCASWRDKRDRRRRQSERLGTLETLRANLTRQAGDLSDHDRTVRAVVLDARLVGGDVPAKRGLRTAGGRTRSRRTAAKRRRGAD